MQKPATTVRFFDRSDYYSLHGEDAHLAAKFIFKTTSAIKTMAPSAKEELDYVCLSKGNFEIFLRELLLVKNYRVEVFTNTKVCIFKNRMPFNLKNMHFLSESFNK